MAAGAAQPQSAASRIVVANDFQAPVGVFVEDSEGRRRSLGRVAHGKIGLFEAPADLIGEGFRVRVYPIVNPDPWSPPSGMGIKTGTLDLRMGETVIVWVAPELPESSVELRTG